MDNSQNIPVLVKAIRVLTALATDSAAPGPSGLARRLGIAQATCYRIVRTYEQAGWVRRTREGGYELSPALASLLDGLRPHRRLAEIAEPLLRALSQELGLTIKLSVRSGDDAVTVVRCDPPTAMLVTGGSGTAFHLCYGSSGAALAMDLDDAELKRLMADAPKDMWARQTPHQFASRVEACRRQGFCVDRGSYHPDVHSVSTALVDQGRVIASISALGLRNDLTEAKAPRLARSLSAAAKQVAQRVKLDEAAIATPESPPTQRRNSRSRVPRGAGGRAGDNRVGMSIGHKREVKGVEDGQH